MISLINTWQDFQGIVKIHLILKILSLITHTITIHGYTVERVNFADINRD